MPLLRRRDSVENEHLPSISMLDGAWKTEWFKLASQVDFDTYMVRCWKPDESAVTKWVEFRIPRLQQAAYWSVRPGQQVSLLKLFAEYGEPFLRQLIEDQLPEPDYMNSELPVYVLELE